MSDETLRANIVDALNEMMRLLETCTDAELRFELRIKLRELFQLLDRVIVATLDSATPEFAEALESLHGLKESAEQAKVDLQKVAVTIDKASTVLNKVGKLVQNVAGVLSVS